MLPNKKPIPLGRPLRLTDAQLDELSQVTPLDIEKAAAFWRAHVSRKFRTLLDAPLMEDQDATSKQRSNK